ncbi:MAG: NifB/NifX family molybdenum-iron cluster-binding protein [Myxococcales bacterium]|nr:MAG: NifB/NifX family molybdenum-iron cluster-binding protein [Myxococcales bacterium]
MPKIGIPVVKKEDKPRISEHFGKAKWVVLYDTELGSKAFFRNSGLNGKAVVEIMKTNQCTDAIFASIGQGATNHLHNAEIHGWYSDAIEDVESLIEKLSCNELRPLR